MNSYHFDNEREMRNMLINSIGYGNAVLKIHGIDKGHRNGAECHVVTDTGLILVYNEASKKLVTVLIARPAQVQRYYDMIGQLAPRWLMQIALEHQRKGYNES